MPAIIWCCQSAELLLFFIDMLYCSLKTFSTELWRHSVLSFGSDVALNQPDVAVLVTAAPAPQSTHVSLTMPQAHQQSMSKGGKSISGVVSHSNEGKQYTRCALSCKKTYREPGGMHASCAVQHRKLYHTGMQLASRSLVVNTLKNPAGPYCFSTCRLMQNFVTHAAASAECIQLHV